MQNLLDLFRPRADAKKDGKNITPYAAGGPVTNPSNRASLTAKGPLPRAAAIYGGAAAVFAVVTVLYLFRGQWFTGLIMIVPTFCLGRIFVALHAGLKDKTRKDEAMGASINDCNDRCNYDTGRARFAADFAARTLVSRGSNCHSFSLSESTAESVFTMHATRSSSAGRRLIFRRLFAAVTVCATAFLLSACEDDPSRTNPALLPVHAVPTDPDQVGLRLARAAEQASVAQNHLAQIEAFRTPMPSLGETGAPPPSQNQFPSPPYPYTQTNPGMPESAAAMPPSMAYEQGVYHYQPIPGMEQVTSLAWTGPIEQITRTLSEMAGLTFQTTGKEPPLPVIVQVDAHQQPVGKILQDIGLQAGRRADIVIDTLNRTLDLRYAPNDGILTQY